MRLLICPPKTLQLEVNYIPINSMEILRTFKNLRNKKVPGKDGLNKEILASTFNRHPTIFTKILNNCIKFRIFPNCWKHGNVVLFPKLNKDLTRVDSYRPICLLSVWGKLFDKILTNRLDNYLETSNYYNKHQYGFRKYRSTLKAMNNVKNFILEISGAFNNAS